MSKPHLSTKEQLNQYLESSRRYTALLFVVFLVAIYGFLAWRIMSLSGAEPDQEAINAGLQTVGAPRVDQDVIEKMQKLEDNSVSVKSLFDEARSNPFQE